MSGMGAFRLRLSAAAELLRHYGAAFRHAWGQRAALDGPGFDRLEAEFLPAALSLQHTPTPAAPRVTMWLLIGFAACALLWAVFGQIDIVATAPGKVVPNGRTKTIQPFERSTVQAIHVTDGQRVRAGDVLIAFDGTGTGADRERLARELAAAQLQAARAAALLDAVDANAAPRAVRPEGVVDALWADSARQLDGQFREYADKRRRLDADVAQRDAELVSARALVNKLEQTVPLAQARAADYKGLAAQNFISRHGWLEKEQARIDLEGELAAQRSRVVELGAALDAARSARTAFVSELRRTLLDGAGDARLNADRLAQELRKATSSDRRNVLTAPVDGTVQQLSVHTVGGVVKEADPLMLIVPSDGPVEIEARIENKDVGFVRAGQPAEVKVETFQFTKYGTVPAEVVSVSDDAVEDREHGLVYIARVRLARSTLDVDGRPVRLSPGMAVTTEIRTGRRRVVEYFLSPLLRAADESLRER